VPQIFLEGKDIMPSASASLLTHVAAFRNPPADAKASPFGKVAAAQAAYVLIIPFAIVEAAISLAGQAGARLLKVDAEKYQSIQEWKTSSHLCVRWALNSAITNLFMRKIAATEAEFRAIPRGREDGFKKAKINAVELPLHFQPPKIDPAVTLLLQNYELGDNAKAHSDAEEKIYRELKDPSLEELHTIGENIHQLLLGSCELGFRNKMREELYRIGRIHHRNVQDDRYIKMIIAIYNTFMTSNDETVKEIIRQGLADASENCNRRKTTEIQQLFFRYVVPDLNTEYLKGLTTEETLIFEMMRYREQLRNKIVSSVFNDPHYLHHFCKKFNETVFYLPPPANDPEHDIGVNLEAWLERQLVAPACKSQEPHIIQTFKRCYETPETIYAAFEAMVYPKTGDTFLFKSAKFTDSFPEEVRVGDDFFDEEDYTKIKPTHLIDYLEKMGLLKRKE
jgi:hypothetical protein